MLPALYQGGQGLKQAAHEGFPEMELLPTKYYFNNILCGYGN
ncbi:hypothetical protein CFter6_0036 [Collimonas fungivorans]|uniref:Uncharacterized protein n=1 Tax=Collimonas fungivorans TaxID=158899 RepID=A0A127P4U4_9BURK|nr:hypothetical protein CFter6_0036 [Collimonas fungivorans]